MMSPNQYLDAHHITFYMEDCVTQLLLYREDNPKVNAKNFMADYFKCLSSGNHVLLRDFAFVSATPHNRLSFVRLIYRAYCNLDEIGDCLSLQELHSLLLLLCPDLPWRLVELAGRTVKEMLPQSSASTPSEVAAQAVTAEALKQARFLFSEFLTAFQIHLLYDEFLDKCAQLYESMLSGRSSNIDVFLPQADQQQQQQQQQQADAAASVATTAPELLRVSTSAYTRLIDGVCQELQLHVPNMDIIKRSLGSNRTTTYREFITGLVRNKELAAALVTESHDLQTGVESPAFSVRWPLVTTVAPGSSVAQVLMTSPQQLPAAAEDLRASSTAASSNQTAQQQQQQQQRQKRLIAGAARPSVGAQKQQQRHSRGGHSRRNESTSGSSDDTGSSGGGSTDTDSDSV